MKNNRFIGPVMLLIAAFIWGSAFVAQSAGAEYVGPFTFLCLRSFLGSAVLLPVILVINRTKQKKENYIKPTKKDRNKLLLSGILCGIVLFTASASQQIGLDKGTEPGKAGFITALYMLIVPIFSLFSGKKIRPIIWPCVAVGIIALYLLCVKEDKTIIAADFYVLACAVLYAVHILVIDRYSPEVDSVSLSALQFLVAGVISLICAVCFESISLEQIKPAIPSVLYAGVMSSGVAFTFQIVAQKRTEPTVASMLMSLESVFAVLTSMVVLGQIPTLREAIGCVLMFAAIIVVQLPEKKKA